MSTRLILDLARCDQCEQCTVDCTYFYRAGDRDNGIVSLRELATFALLCRRCEEASCVDACKFDALERDAAGVLKRYNMRCVSCKCCAHACPFGTIYPDLLPYQDGRCDYCLAQTADGEQPACVASCENNAIEYRDVDDKELEDLHEVNDRLVVRAPKWEKEAV